MLPALSLLFFFSGASALIYQVLWLRMLGLVFGVTTYAASTVWASFMAGLALGSMGAGRLADRVRKPLMWFGLCEMLIGATALATPSALSLLQNVYVRVHPSIADSLPAMTTARFAIAFAVLIGPTALMGATLPLVMKSSTFRTSRFGQRMALLYAMNTAGAIAGALAAGLHLIQNYGIRTTFVLAAAVNMAVGIAAVLLGRYAAAPDPAHEASSAVDAGRDGRPALEPRQLALILAVFAISGFTSLAFEVVWFRVLTLFLRPTVYGFALMLASVLAGIAIGSYLITPLLERRVNWIAILGGLEIAIGVAAVVSFDTLSAILPVTDALTPFLSRLMDAWLVYPAVGSMLAIFPTALLMGMAFPIGLRLWSTGGDRSRGLAERVGTFYSMNVAAAIPGSIAAGFLLLPALGSHASLVLLGGISVLSGLTLFAVSDLTRPVRLVAGIVGVCVFVLALASSSDPFIEFVRQRYPGWRILWQEEGVEATVVVLASDGGETSLTVNGSHQASTGGAQVFVHRVIGHLPMLIHPEARDALVIGLGGGATAGAVALHDGVDVDIVELAGAVVRGAQQLDSAINYGLFARPNAHVRVDDGRNFMMMTRRKYDVVTADVILPIHAGSGNLYSAEYFRLVRGVLKPGGIVLQWVSGTDAEYKTITRTFLSVFPHATAWRDGTLLVGSMEPLKLKRGDFEWKLQVPGRAQAAKDVGLSTFDELIASFKSGPDDLRAFIGPGPILTDDKPIVEYFLSLPRAGDVNLGGLKGDARTIVVE